MDHRRLSQGMIDFADSYLLKRQARKTACAANALAGARRRLNKAWANADEAERWAKEQCASTLTNIATCFETYPHLALAKPINQVASERKTLMEAYFQFGQSVFASMRAYGHRDVCSSVLVCNYLAAASLAITAYEDPPLLDRLVRVGLGIEASPYQETINDFLSRQDLTGATCQRPSWGDLSQRLKVGAKLSDDSNLPHPSLLVQISLRDRLRVTTGIISSEDSAQDWQWLDESARERLQGVCYPMTRADWNLYPEWLKPHLTDTDRQFIDELRLNPLVQPENNHV